MVPLLVFIRRANQWILWGNLRLDLLHIEEDGLKLDRHVSLPIRHAIFLDVFRYAAFAFGYAQQISQIKISTRHFDEKFEPFTRIE